MFPVVKECEAGFLMKISQQYTHGGSKILSEKGG